MAEMGVAEVKDVFGEWYEPDDDELAFFIKEGRIALDTNVLFSLYRVNAVQRKQVLDVFAEVADRLWIPFQVGLEYQRGRLDRIVEQNKAYGDVAKAVVALRNAADKALRDEELKDKVLQRIGTFEAEIGKLLEELKAAHSIDEQEARHADPVRIALDSIFTTGRVGAKPEDLEDRRRLALERIESKTPPGYKDVNKGDPTGDVLIWFELLDMGAEATGPVLFITDDVKEDWYRKVDGKIVGPLPELRREWATRATVPYHQTRLGSFLDHAKKHLNLAIDEETISGVKAAQNADVNALVSRLRHPSRRYEMERLLGVLPRGYEPHELLTVAGAMLDGEVEFNPTVLDRVLAVVENQRSDESAAVSALLEAAEVGDANFEEIALDRLEHLASRGLLSAEALAIVRSHRTFATNSDVRHAKWGKSAVLRELRIRMDSMNPGMAQAVSPGAGVESSASRASRYNRYFDLWHQVNTAPDGSPIVEAVARELDII